MRKKLRVVKSSIGNALLRLLKLSSLIGDMVIENRGYIRNLQGEIKRLEERYENR